MLVSGRGGRREGAGRPPKPDAKQRIQGYVHPDVLEAINEAAERHGLSRSEMVEYALTGYLMEHEGLTLVL